MATNERCRCQLVWGNFVRDNKNCFVLQTWSSTKKVSGTSPLTEEMQLDTLGSGEFFDANKTGATATYDNVQEGVGVVFT